MTSPTVAGIDLMELAGRLTPAQRKALYAGSVWRFKTGRQLLRHAKLTRWPFRPNYREFSYLWEYEAHQWGYLYKRRLSPAGIAVRDALRARASLIEEERS